MQGQRPGQQSNSDTRSQFYMCLKRLTSGNARRPSDLCWLIQLAWALLEAGEDLVVLEALGSSSSRGSSYTGAAAASMSGLELLRELVCSTASGANCKLVLDSPNAAAAGVNLLQLVVVVDDHWRRFPAACGAAAQGVRSRRLQLKLEQLQGVIGQRMNCNAALSTLQQRTRQVAAAASAATAHRVQPVLPEQLPGELRQPGGPRHDNDHADFRRISIAPTQQQVLCDVDPYLPRNM
ncbi:hypothetical protein OEZ85_005168 [Tetradesmus obliquus]|uniref:Uncharacterized protein n=1 Tax=Tetradesmus obliquus TaxID=3088 RepID=A0ABY8UH12_TETOB|nr:hypothetical protein OEZ85_005168 [Tetradesmus obliquus]